MDVAGSTPAEPAKIKDCQDKYAEQLGMPLGTAEARLKKLIMFDMIKRLGLDCCYRCEEPIETVEDLDVDHKEPWRGLDTELFWNLDNIAYSHHKCNIAASRKTRKMGPEGTSWCSTHKEFLPVESFGKDSDRWSGLNTTCLDCDRKRQRAYENRNPRFPCPQCRYQMRKKCQRCGHELSMAQYMALRRKEGVKY